MKIVVLKFGGTSVGTIKKIKRVAKIIIGYKEKNYKVIVVSSAILENFSISFLLIVLLFISKLTLYSTCILSIYFNFKKIFYHENCSFKIWRYIGWHN